MKIIITFIENDFHLPEALLERMATLVSGSRKSAAPVPRTPNSKSRDPDVLAFQPVRCRVFRSLQHERTPVRVREAAGEDNPGWARAEVFALPSRRGDSLAGGPR
jgi:hypothetical protein